MGTQLRRTWNVQLEELSFRGRKLLALVGRSGPAKTETGPATTNLSAEPELVPRLDSLLRVRDGADSLDGHIAARYQGRVSAQGSEH